MVASSPAGPFVSRARPTAARTRLARPDDADEPSIADHWKPLDAPALHQLNYGFERVMLANEDWISRHDLTDLSAVGMHVLLGKPAGSKQEFEPCWPRALRAE